MTSFQSRLKTLHAVVYLRFLLVFDGRSSKVTHNVTQRRNTSVPLSSDTLGVVTLTYLLTCGRSQCRRTVVARSNCSPIALVTTALLGVYTVRSSDRPVGPTGLSDWSVRRSYRVNAQLDRHEGLTSYLSVSDEE